MGEWIITSSILIVFIILIRGLCKDKIGLRARYALWLVVAVRLLVPFSFAESSLSVLNFLEAGGSGQAQELERKELIFPVPVVPETGKVVTENGSGGVSAGNTGQGEPFGTAAEVRPFAWKKVLGGIWLTGAVLLAGTVLLLNGDYRRRIYCSRRKCRLSLKSRLPVYLSPVVETPCMYGLISPAIYLTPGIEKNEKKLKYVLCHENTHYRNHDNLWALVRAVCLCIHWYNPLVWAAAAISRQDCELACDEEALKLLGEEERISYGRTLLDFSIQGDTIFHGLQLTTAVAGGKRQLKERLMMIVGQPRRQTGALVLAMGLTLAVSAAAFTGKVNGQESENGSREADIQNLSADAEGSSNPVREDRVESTSIVSLDLKDGRDYTLKLGGEAAAEDGKYRVSRLELNWIHDRVEENVQTIELENVGVLCTRPAGEGGEGWYSGKQESLYAKPLYAGGGGFSANGELSRLQEISGIFAEDLNFDGYKDFYLQGISQGANIPCYCYLWNPGEKRFEPGYMIPNLRVNPEEELLESATEDGNNVFSVKYYRFDDQNSLHMLRYTEENRSQDALFPSLDLTYCETAYGLPAVDEWDYGTVYGGALTERFVYWAKQALTELYEITGTKLDTLCFSMTSFGDVSFGQTPADVVGSRIFFDRVYGERAGFESCIEHVGLATERTVWFSPVTQWRVPENLDKMTDSEVVRWYFERLPLTEGEIPESIEPWTDGYMIRAESGNYYKIFLQPVTRELNQVYGPYGTRPNN